MAYLLNEPFRQCLGASHQGRHRFKPDGERSDEELLSSFKTERTARKVYRTRDHAKADVFDFIERS
jgi:hypothetical protein